MKTLRPRFLPTPAPRQSPAARGYDSKWRRARIEFLSANPLCVYCKESNRIVPATVVDHIAPHHGDQNLFWSVANWQPLCASCHSGRKQREEHRRGER